MRVDLNGFIFVSIYKPLIIRIRVFKELYFNYCLEEGREEK